MSDHDLEKAENLGAKAYREGDVKDDCPFDEETQYRLYDAWRFGFITEKKYFESKIFKA